MDKISVIVPIYNVEPYIERAIWSLLLQTVDDLEIILVDDGSTDKSGEICEKIKRTWETRQQTVNRTILIRHICNSGQSHARNVGLKLATGNYIGFLDGDDACKWNMYEVLLNALNKSNADIAECNFSGRKVQAPDDVEEDAEFILSGRDALVKHLNIRPASRFPSTSVWSKLFRRSVLDELLFPDGRVHEEYAFIAQALYRANKYVYINSKLYERTLRDDSTTAEKFSLKSLDKLYVYRERAEFLEETGDQELIELAMSQEYVLMMQLYYSCKINGMNQSHELERELKSEKNNISKSLLSNKNKAEYSFVVSLPYLYGALKKLKNAINKNRLNKGVYHLCYLLRKLLPSQLHVMGLAETIKKIEDSNLSLIRYGDGELLMIKGKNISEQKADKALGLRLLEVLKSDDPNILYGICDIFSSLDQYTVHSREFWEEHLFYHRKEYLNYCRHDKLYCDSLVTRPYFMLKDKNESGEVFSGFKKIWKGKRIILVEGAISHNGVDNDLFGTAHSVKRIIVPSKNCFSKYEEILSSALKNAEKDVLFLVSIGASSKPLVYDLVHKGYRAIDIGNLDMEYEWFLHHSNNKYQLLKHDIDNETLDRKLGYDEYLSQIVSRIC